MAMARTSTQLDPPFECPLCITLQTLAFPATEDLFEIIIGPWFDGMGLFLCRRVSQTTRNERDGFHKTSPGTHTTPCINTLALRLITTFSITHPPADSWARAPTFKVPEG